LKVQNVKCKVVVSLRDGLLRAEDLSEIADSASHEAGMADDGIKLLTLNSFSYKLDWKRKAKRRVNDITETDQKDLRSENKKIYIEKENVKNAKMLDLVIEL